MIRPQFLYRVATGTLPTPGAVLLIRVLGARNLLQALLLARAGRTLRRCGAIVDLTHAGTMVALASGDRRWRKPAGIDAFLASTFAALEAR
ncbi:hypothetical protein [Sanguibacter gelidistatuariae]|nr:hypothetical protein [Sanguibacter gelidistatuariae]